VTGATVGIGVAVEVAVTVGVGVGVRVTVWVARGVWVARAVSVAVELEPVPGVPVVEELPAEGVSFELPAEAEAEIVPLPETITVGEMTVGVVGDDEVHAVSATGATRASAPQHNAVSRTPSVVRCTFMDPPHAPGR
jgi:hypothetical protein